MKTVECRNRLKDFYCSLGISGYPVESIENRCPFFDKSKHAFFRSNKFLDIRLRDTYVGCFSDDPRQRFLTGFTYQFHDENSPEYCVQACLRAGFQYAGVEYSYECFCGDAPNLNQEQKLTDDKLCQLYACPGNQSHFCGGNNTISVYSTGILEKTKPMPMYVPLPSNNSLKTAEVTILFLFQLNGRNIRQIKRVLRMLYSPKHLYYFHVDSRQEFMYKEIKKLVKTLHSNGITNVYISEKRYSAVWAGVGLLKMLLGVIKATIETKGIPHWDYFLNLSETDMPLLSIEELEHIIASHMGKSFLSSHGEDTANFIRKQGFDFFFFECENRNWLIKNRNNYPKNLRIDGGSDWVVLHRDFAKFAISESNDYVVNMRKMFSSILMPLESFFHTLALNSEFCDKIVYFNLHLINWNRKQGCRCEVHAKEADWCGCSPNVVKMKDITQEDISIEVERAQKWAIFFVRKVESIIDSDVVAHAERQVFRFRPNMIPSSSSVFNSTWLNFYDKSVDSINPKRILFENWARILFTDWLSSQSSQHIRGCSFSDLLEIFAYKKFSTAPIQLILTVKDTCENTFELLVERKQNFRIFENATVDGYYLISMATGVNLDLKEEIFRDFTGLIDTSGTATILWQWYYANTSNQILNTTSPKINIEWVNPNGKTIKTDQVLPYDSIHYAQYANLNFQHLLKDIIPGHWKAILLSAEQPLLLGEISFPIFPDFSNREKIEDVENLIISLVNKNFQLLDICSRSVDQTYISVCKTSVLWSTEYPDLKSDFLTGL